LAWQETQTGPDRIADLNSTRILLWALALIVFMALIVSGLALYVLSDKDFYRPLYLSRTLSLIRQLYPESYHAPRLISEAREAIFDRLDRFSGYLEPEEWRRVAEEFSGSYGGIGISVVSHKKGLSVMSVRESGPAERAGMRTGDIIIRADSTDLENLSPYRASFYLRGDEGTTVTITAVRNDWRDTLVFELEREKLRLIHIPYAGYTDNGSLYIRILDFEAGLSEELRHIYDSLAAAGDDSITSVILDVRGNPGGLLSEAVAVSDMFLDRGHLIVGVKGRSRWQKSEFHSSGRDLFDGAPLAVVINRGSASAAEILAGALKYAGRAILIGDTTYGKGLVQEYARLFDGSGIRLTTARYYFEGEVYINQPDASVIDSAAGIPPDYYFRADEAEDFPVALEGSSLMRDFAVANSDRILEYSPFTETDPAWFHDFVAYARDHEFRYESELTRFAEYSYEEVALDIQSPEVLEAIKNILEIARENDTAQFDKYKNFIKRRLFQMAVESESGLAAAYQRAIVPYRQEIILAEKMLLLMRK